MNIVHIDTGTSWRGGQNQVLLLTRGLQKRGYNQVLLCQKSGELAARARESGIPTREMAMHGEIDPFAIMRIRKIYKEFNAAICHCHTSHAHGLGLLATLGSNNTKVLVTRRVDFAIGRNFLSRRKYYSPKVYYIAISDGVQRVLLEAVVPEDRITLVRSGIDLERFAHIDDGDSLRKEFALPDETIVIGTVGHLVDHKGHIYLVRAAPNILERFPNAVFIIVGEGEERSVLEAEIQRLNLKDRFILPGYRTDIGKFLKLFDIFVLPSHLEGLCTSLLDAMAVGVPIVATDTGGVPDVISDHSNGLLAKPRNPRNLARKIIRLLENTHLQNRFVAEGEKMVKERFTADRMVEGTLKVYKEITGR